MSVTGLGVIPVVEEGYLGINGISVPTMGLLPLCLCNAFYNFLLHFYFLVYPVLHRYCNQQMKNNQNPSTARLQFYSTDTSNNILITFIKGTYVLHHSTPHLHRECTNQIHFFLHFYLTYCTSSCPIISLLSRFPFKFKILILHQFTP